MASDELKEFEEQQDRKYANLQRIQERMAARQKQRKAPRKTELPKKKKLKNIENPEWKAKAEKDRKEKEKLIAAKYKEQKKRKQKLEKERQAKADKILERKYKEENKKRKKLPNTKKWAKNLAKQQMETQRKIDEKYALKKQKDKMNEAEFKIKAAAIEKKYDDKKPKKKKRDPKKKAVVIDNEHNAFTAVENADFDLLDRIYSYYPNDIKRKDKQGNTILHHAIKHYVKRKNDNIECIEYVIPKLPPSYMNAVNFLGNTPMNVAVFERKFECMKALYSCSDMKRRPNLDHMNINGRTVLMQAAMRDDDELIRFLLDCVPPPNIDVFAEKHGKTALTYAVEHKQSKAVKVLVANGANLYIKNKIGKHAREIAEDDIHSLRFMIDQERVNVVKGCVQSTLVKRLNFPDYLIAIIAQYVAAVPQEVLDREEAERKKSKKKKKNGRRRGRGRGRGRGRRG